MLRVHTTFDLLEAHIIASVLRCEGIDARVFDADFVRLDWFKQLVYGGFRIVVAPADAAAALAALERLRTNEFALPDEGLLRCPTCGHEAAGEDPRPRRCVFLALIVLDFVAGSTLVPTTLAAPGLLRLLGVTAALLPGLALRWYKWAAQCRACGHRWHQPPLFAFRHLAAAAERGAAAEASG
jgi:hypothetical protein